MRLKTWQIITLILGSIFTCCLACVSISLLADGLNWLDAADHDSRSAEVLPLTAIAAQLQIQSPTPVPSQTPTMTVTPQFSVIAACIPPNLQEQARVIRVLDGDTIEVEISGRYEQVRYIGIDAPDYYASGGAEAAQANRDLVADQDVILIKDQSEVDELGRLLRYVAVGDLFVNQELVRQGYAAAHEYPPDIACHSVFADAQNAALTDQLGLWSEPSPTPPIATIAVPLLPSRSGSSGAICRCTGPDLDCDDFLTRADAQACFDYCRSLGYGDIFRLDADHDNLACESKP